MYHKVWDHNALRRGFFKEFATEINAKIDERAREIAKRMIANGKLTNEEIANCSGLSIEEVVVLRSQAVWGKGEQQSQWAGGWDCVRGGCREAVRRAARCMHAAL